MENIFEPYYDKTLTAYRFVQGDDSGMSADGGLYAVVSKISEETYAAKRLDDTWVNVDASTGKALFTEGYDYLGPVRCGRCVGLRDGQYCLLDRDGKVIIPLGDYIIRTFNGGRSWKGVDNVYRLIDTDGNYVGEEEYSWGTTFNNGRAIVSNGSVRWLVDTDGKKVSEYAYPEMVSIDVEGPNRYYVQRDGRYYLTDEDGALIHPRRADGTIVEEGFLDILYAESMNKILFYMKSRGEAPGVMDLNGNIEEWVG